RWATAALGEVGILHPHSAVALPAIPRREAGAALRHAGRPPGAPRPRCDPSRADRSVPEADRSLESRDAVAGEPRAVTRAAARRASTDPYDWSAAQNRLPSSSRRGTANVD